jgi:hypothetical protein
MEVATFLYPAKAAAGPCARLARCGGRGFRMRACRLVVYLIKYNLLIIFLIYYYIYLLNFLILFFISLII